jgi:hypothetical protein
MNVAKTVKEILPYVKDADIMGNCKNVLNVLSTDKDLDVVFFSQQAIKKL